MIKKSIIYISVVLLSIFIQSCEKDVDQNGIGDAYISNDTSYSIFYKNEGSTNDTQALIDFLETNKKVYFPQGEYFFDINKIKLESNTTFIGDENKTIFNILNDGEFKSTNPPALFKVYGKVNIKIFNLSFKGKNNSCVVLGVYSSQKSGKSKNIEMAYNITNKMGLLWVSPEKGFTFNRIDEKSLDNNSWAQVGEIDEFDITEHIIVSHNIIIGDNKKQLNDFYKNQVSGVSLLFVRDAKIYENTISHLYFGIWAYAGGTLSSDKSHLTNNPIWCKDIAFYKNIVNTTFSPFWASRCENVSMYNNYSKDNIDVAADFEGCINSSANNNTIINSHGGALTPLNGSMNLTFENNYIESYFESTYDVNIIFIRNANKNVFYNKNVFKATGDKQGKIWLGRTDTFINSNQNIVFKDNNFTNIYEKNTDNSEVIIDSTNIGLQ